jgi:hypothetical protein
VLQATGSDCRECPVRGALGLLDFVCRAMCGQAVFLLPDLPHTSLVEVYSICMYAYVYVYVYVCMYTYIWICMYILLHAADCGHSLYL